MAGRLDGKTIAFLATEGVEQVELTEPWERGGAGGRHARADLAREGTGPGFNHHRKAADASRYDEGKHEEQRRRVGASA